MNIRFAPPSRGERDSRQQLAEALGWEDGRLWAKRAAAGEYTMPGRAVVAHRELQELAARNAAPRAAIASNDIEREKLQAKIATTDRETRQSDDERDEALRAIDSRLGPRSPDGTVAQEACDEAEKDYTWLKRLNDNREPPSLGTLLLALGLGYLGIAAFEQRMTADLLAQALMQPRIVTTVMMGGFGFALAVLAHAAGSQLKLAHGPLATKFNRWVAWTAICLASAVVLFLVALNAGVINVGFEAAPFPGAPVSFSFGLASSLSGEGEINTHGTAVIVGVISALIVGGFAALSYWLQPKVPGLGAAKRRRDRCRKAVLQLKKAHEAECRTTNGSCDARKHASEAVQHSLREKLDRLAKADDEEHAAIQSNAEQAAAQISACDAAYLHGFAATTPPTAALPPALTPAQAMELVREFLERSGGGPQLLAPAR